MRVFAVVFDSFSLVSADRSNLLGRVRPFRSPFLEHLSHAAQLVDHVVNVWEDEGPESLPQGSGALSLARPTREVSVCESSGPCSPPRWRGAAGRVRVPAARLAQRALVRSLPQPHRTVSTLATQAEWQTRLLPAATDQMAREATGCRHRNSQLPRRPPRAWPGHPARATDRRSTIASAWVNYRLISNADSVG
jgi:hypothetical protein